MRAAQKGDTADVWALGGGVGDGECGMRGLLQQAMGKAAGSVIGGQVGVWLWHGVPVTNGTNQCGGK